MTLSVPLSMKRVFYLATVALAAAVVVVDATQVMRRPAEYKETPNKVKTTTKAKTEVIQKRASSHTQFAYFTNWSVSFHRDFIAFGR